MAHLKFEGDLTNISAQQIEYISEVLQERGYDNEKVLIEAVGKPGDNYIANVKRISVEKDGAVFKMIAKIAPTNEVLRATANTAVMFNNEHIIYTEVLPKFTEIEKSADIPKEDRLRYAACYGSNQEAPNEVILLEDLKESGFTIFDRFVSIPNDAVKLVLKNFASLHSLSYALKHKEPDTYNNFKAKLLNIWEMMDEIPQIKLYFDGLEKQILSLFKNDKLIRLLKDRLGQIVTLAVKAAKVDRQSKFSVIQQGDSWTNNIMFVLQEGNPIECCMIDYQGSKESSPVADLHYMIFNCTDYKLRSEYYHEWIDYYYTELDKALSNFGLKANFIYPKDQLDAEMRRYGKLSLATSLMLSTVLLRESSEAAKMKDAMENVSGEENVEEIIKTMTFLNGNDDIITKLTERVEGLVNSFIELGYII